MEFFICIDEYYSIVWMYHASTEGYLGNFQFGANTNKIAMNIHIQVPA